VALLGNLTGSSQFFNPPAFYNGVATQSLRFDDGSSHRLTRTFSGDPDNAKKMTISVWAKRGNVTTGSTQVIIANYNSVRFLGELAWDGTDILRFDPGGNGDGSSNSYKVQTTALFRDVSAWYHIVLAYDTTQGTDTNRVKLYVNGTQQTLTAPSGQSFPPEDYLHLYSYQGANNTIGEFGAGFDSGFLDGYLSEFNFVDGLALAPSSFGETKNGVWIAKEYTGSYGTNGFRLQFNQTGVGTASTTTIGADTSGNNNHFTSSGIVASDCAMPDSPENNFCTWNPLTIGAQGTLAEGNLKNTAFWSSDLSGNASTFFPESGKWYWELRIDGAGTYPYIGITSQEKTNDTVNGGTFYNIAWRPNGTGVSSGSSLGTITKENIPSFADDAIISFALDVDARKLWVAENNTYADSGDPANGSGENASWTVDVDVSPFAMGYQSQGVGTIANFGQDDTFAGAISSAGNTDGNGKGVFKYAPPSGYLALCTANLPEPTISPNAATQADEYFNTAIYTGNGGTIDIAVGFQPDFSWYKCRAGGANRWHYLFDSNRGANKALYSNLTGAEDSETPTYNTQSFQPDGTRIVRTNGDHLNNNGDTYVSWNWKGGTNASNSDGSITSTVQANTDAGFSIVTYTASASSSVYTIGHGLTKAPELIINKDRDSAGAWWSFTTLIDGSVDYVRLDGTNAKADDTASLGVPTTSVFSQVENYTPASSNNVAYCFHSVEGYSKFGIYTGNGNADGTFVYTGFRPAFIMYKRTDTTGNWLMDDNKTSTYNYDSNYLLANSADVEGDTTTNAAGHMFDHLSNGFKMRNTNADRNASGGTYIYMAFAEAPFKYANAR